ncbi:hypothetical protein BaRGS_00020795 [Batillaria attramentaria]|uniref:EF-hand domain-containing protein n=1 Tax=Batillaria attramentaria TaxID=370345 RepID=A0ABD0KLA4_9CAEN
MAFSMYANKEPVKVRRRTISRASSRRSQVNSSQSKQSKQAERGQSSCSDSEDDARTRDSDAQGVDINDEKAWDTDLENEDESHPSYDHSGRTAYIQACKKLGVVPVSYFLRHMHDQELNMKHHGLGATGMQAISGVMMGNTKILTLDLSDNWLGMEGGLAVCEMLRENCFITTLTLNDNRLNHCAKELCQTMLMNSSLQRVTLAGNGFDDKAAVHFAEFLLTCHLEYLNLSHNDLGEAAGLLLGPAISENSTLKELDLSWNQLRRKGAMAIGIGVKTNVKMKKINLSWNGFGLEGAIGIADALKGNSVLEEIDISNNRIMTEGAVLIGKGLSANETLKVLKMGKNPMQSAGCWGICAAILRNPNCALQELDFENITVNRDFDEIYKQVQEQIPDLKLRHGGTEIPLKPRPPVDPMNKLMAYVDKHNLRIVDFFNKFDKDGSMSVSYDEFKQGLQDMGISLTEEEVHAMLTELDRDGDGEINYSELVIGHADFQEKSREPKVSVSLFRPMTS